MKPPQRAQVPLWLALLLKRQHRANILPPPWLLCSALENILRLETELQSTFTPPMPDVESMVSTMASPPFLNSSTATGSSEHLPYHWLELGEILLEACSDDIPESDRVRSSLRDLREVRLAKMRASVKVLDGGGLSDLTGVGAMEIAEGRAFIVGVMDGLRQLGAGREAQRRKDQADGDGGDMAGDSDDDMLY